MTRHALIHDMKMDDYFEKMLPPLVENSFTYSKTLKCSYSHEVIKPQPTAIQSRKEEKVKMASKGKVFSKGKALSRSATSKSAGVVDAPNGRNTVRYSDKPRDFSVYGCHECDFSGTCIFSSY